MSRLQFRQFDPYFSSFSVNRYPESVSLIWLCRFQAILQTPAGEA